MSRPTLTENDQQQKNTLLTYLFLAQLGLNIQSEEQEASDKVKNDVPSVKKQGISAAHTTFAADKQKKHPKNQATYQVPSHVNGKQRRR